MDFNKFTHKSREALQKAHDLAKEKKHGDIQDIHLLAVILQEDASYLAALFELKSDSIHGLQAKVTKAINALPVLEPAPEQLYLSRECNQVLEQAIMLSKKWGDDFVSLELMLLAMLEYKSAAGKILHEFGLDVRKVETNIQKLRKGGKVKTQSAEDNYQSLERYAKNLNELAKAGKLDPVIGRDDEIRRVLQILSRRTKNNPILVGEPGVGKTAIAEGIAHRIINEDIPETLKSKNIYALDMGQLVAGAKYKGEFEERLKSVVKEVVDSAGEIILFIDEIHTLVGAGGGEGAMDAANILKPALARGELRAVGATTLKEYQKYFEKDKALERRFQMVLVDEPGEEESISILRGLKERYENHHKVRILDEAIVAAVQLSTRYISDRFLPDKAIDLMDEAAAKMRIEIDSLPEELDEMERRVRQLEIEREAIKREKDKEKLKRLSEELANLIEERDKIKSVWLKEKEIINGIQSEKRKIEQYRTQAEQAEREGNYGKVAEIRYGKVSESEQKIDLLQKELKAYQKDGGLINEEINAEAIAEVVSRWTGIPLNKMLQSEREKLLHLEEELHKRVVGQDEAIEAISNAIRRSRAGLHNPRKPIGSFIFLGSTGVGKTELAKAVAAYLFNDENNMVRIDMSEYQERHAVSRLIGAPPGYVGYDEGGQLTEAVRRKPYAVILLDEIEKAHPDVFNILLQVLEDGRLTDNKGRVANFKNTIVILTSNLGSHLLMEGLKEKEIPSDVDFNRMHEQIMALLKQNLRPEFLNRIDEIITFKPLTQSEIEKIVRLQMADINRMISEQGLQLELSDTAISVLAKEGFDPQFGARPVKRLIQRAVLNPISKMILSGDLNQAKSIKVDYNGEKFIFSS